MSSSDASTTNSKLICAAAAVSVVAWTMWRYTVKNRRRKLDEAKTTACHSDKDVKNSTTSPKVSDKKFDLASLLRREEITYGKFLTNFEKILFHL